MGKSETQSSKQETFKNTQTQTVEATPQEQRLNKLQMRMLQGAMPGIQQVQGAGSDLVSQLLTGQALPGAYSGLYQGISPEITDEIVQASLRDIYPQFQGLGILDSGVAASIAGRTAGDIRRNVAQYNQGVRTNLLGMALSGAGNIQQPFLASMSDLGSRLAGLRTINTTGSGSSTSTATVAQPNPFIQSFQQSLGQSLGQNLGYAFGPTEGYNVWA